MSPEDRPSRMRLLTAGRSVGKSAVAVATFAAAVTGSLAALGVIGGSDESGSALALAAEKTADAGSSRVALTTTLRQGSKSPEVLKGTGAFDYVGESGYLDYTSGLKQILLKPYAYLRFPEERVWCRYDLSVLGPGFLFGAITGFKSDPAAALVNLEESGEYEEEGSETLFGVETTRYAGEVDLQQLLDREADKARRDLLLPLARYNDNKLPLQVWIGEDDLPRRINTSFSVPGSEFGLRGVVKTEVSIDFRRFGVRVNVQPPPSSKTLEAGSKACGPAP